MFEQAAFELVLAVYVQFSPLVYTFRNVVVCEAEYKHKAKTTVKPGREELILLKKAAFIWLILCFGCKNVDKLANIGSIKISNN